MSNDRNSWIDGSASRDQMMNLQEELKAAKLEKERQVRQNSEIVLRANALTRERDQLRERLEATVSERDRLIAECATAPDRAVSLERRLEELTRELSNTQNETVRLQQALADTKAELLTKTEGFKREISDLNHSLADAAEKRDIFANEKLELEKRAASAQQELSQSNQSLNDCQTKNACLEQELAQIRAEMTAKVNSLSSEISELNNRLAVVTKERDSLISEKSAAIESFMETEQKLHAAMIRIASDETEIYRLNDLAADASLPNILRLLYEFTAQKIITGVSWIRSMIPNDSAILPYFDRAIEILKGLINQAFILTQRAFVLAKPRAVELYNRVLNEIENQINKK